jgi:hypothetical protein
MDFRDFVAFVADVEMAFEELPELDRATFGLKYSADAISVDGEVIMAKVFPTPFVATYRGGVRQILGGKVEVIGRCDCWACERKPGRPRYIARVVGTENMVFHSRGTSYLLWGEGPQSNPQNTTELIQ